MILEDFGKSFIQCIRDEVYDDFKKITEGNVKTKSLQLLLEDYEKLSQENKILLERLVACYIDRSIFYTLRFFECEGNNKNGFHISKGKENNIANISDGLAGEIFSEDGWISKFSRYKEAEEIENSPFR